MNYLEAPNPVGGLSNLPAVKTSVPLLWLALNLGASLTAQNLLQHIDGTLEGFSRGPGALNVPLTVIQRFPEEQWCRRACLECVTVDFRDLTPASAEAFSIEVRKGIGPANSPTDAPNMALGGLLAPPIPALKPAGPATLKMTIPVGPCLALPPGVDVYICVVLPAPGDLRVWHSVNEVHRAAPPCPFPARYGAWPDLGLSWVHDASALTQTTNAWLGGLTNWSWAIGASIAEDVCQAFAAGPPPVGPPFNYGYVGIYPNVARVPSDAIGCRLRTRHPPGSPCALILGTSKLFGGPLDMSIFGPSYSGFLCVTPDVVIFGVTSLGLGPCVSMSQAVIGPFPTLPFWCPFDLCAQFVSIDVGAGTLRMSTACVIDL